MHPIKNPGTAAVLSLLIPGVGQFYNGDFWRGIFWLIITPGFWMVWGMLGWVFTSPPDYRHRRVSGKSESAESRERRNTIRGLLIALLSM